jgi:hypothetical protein
MLVAVLTAACAPRVEAASAIEVETVTSGWTAVGPSKVVPVVSFKLKNRSTGRLRSLQVNAVFHRVGDPAEWGTGFVPSVGQDGLEAGVESEAVTITSPLGYTGTESPSDLLKNSRFVDAQVRILARFGSTGWTPLGDYRIARQLLTAF